MFINSKNYVYHTCNEKGVFIFMADNNYIPISAIAGGTFGAIKWFRNPSEKTCLKLAKLEPNMIDTLKEYRDCFDIQAAGSAVREGKMTLNDYKITNNIRTAIHNLFEKEKQVRDIVNTPFEKRTKTYKQAVKEANSGRKELFKSMLKLDKNIMPKLVENNVLDIEKFSKTMKAMEHKLIITLKELAKGALKGLAIGTIAGAIIGSALNKISDKA